MFHKLIKRYHNAKESIKERNINVKEHNINIKEHNINVKEPIDPLYLMSACEARNRIDKCLETDPYFIIFVNECIKKITKADNYKITYKKSKNETYNIKLVKILLEKGYVVNTIYEIDTSVFVISFD